MQAFNFWRDAYFCNECQLLYSTASFIDLYFKGNLTPVLSAISQLTNFCSKLSLCFLMKVLMNLPLFIVWLHFMQWMTAIPHCFSLSLRFSCLGVAYLLKSSHPLSFFLCVQRSDLLFPIAADQPTSYDFSFQTGSTNASCNQKFFISPESFCCLPQIYYLY